MEKTISIVTHSNNELYEFEIGKKRLNHQFTIEEIKFFKEVLNLVIKDHKANKPKIIFHEQLHGEVLKPDLENSDPNSPFFNKKMVITGIFNSFSRDELGNMLRDMGADLNGSVSKKTEFVIVGEDAGPMKLQKIEQFNRDGANIVILNEEELKVIVRNYRNSK